MCSCSSSTTIRPRFSTGENTAERAPTTTRASPEATRRHSSYRSPALRREWITAAFANRARNQETICGVSAISGTSTMAPRPNSSARATARM